MIVLAVIESEYGNIEVLQRRQSGSLVYRKGGRYQSEANRAGANLASYVHTIYGLTLLAWRIFCSSVIGTPRLL
jgi:hypothetical protein